VTFSTDESAGADETACTEVPAAALPRRRFLQVGGASVIGAAVLAACGGPGEQGSIPVAGTGATTTTSPERVVNDAVLLRTASSLEHSILGAYDLAIEQGLIAESIAEAVPLFRDHHEEQAAHFAELTRAAGGQPFEEPNPAVQKNVIDPALALIAENGDQAEDMLYLLYGLEELAAETYQTFVQVLVERENRAGVMAVGGVSARQAAVLAGAIPDSLVVPAEEVPPVDTTAPPTSEGPDEAPDRAPVIQVAGAFQQLTSVQITIGIETINVEPLGPNSYIYEPTAG
jgi:hypothetical protein